MDQDETCHKVTPRPRPHRVTWAYVCCGQTASWIKVPLVTEVGLGPGDIVLDRDPSPQKNRHSPQFLAHVYCRQTVAHLSYC